jgi:hypothetical protein
MTAVIKGDVTSTKMLLQAGADTTLNDKVKCECGIQ